jgi:hypothetical protein
MDKELRITVDDIRTIAYLGKYYAHKILAATYLSLFRESFQKEWVEKSMEELNISAGYWRQYAAGSLANYKTPLWTNRVGYVDLKENFQWAVYDITVNGGDVNLPSMKPTPGGTILEAEDAEYGDADVENDIDGYTGDGYLTKQTGHAQNPVKWTYTAPESGRYILEFRYTLERQQEFLTPLTINGEKVDEIGFWQTGNGGAWVWLRKTVNLEKGENTIEISPEGYVFLDHLNVLKNF